MANMRQFKTSFVGGELSPEMFGRIDDAKFQNGAASIQNLITTPLGPAEKRPGTQYVCDTKNDGVARLIPFTYSTTQTMVIEMGAGYFRFHTQGGTLLVGGSQPAFIPTCGVTYTVASPAVFTATAHGFTNGLSVIAVITGIPPFGSSVSYPTGMSSGPYTVVVVDANNFTLLDSGGNAVNIYAPPAHGGLGIEPNYAIGALASYGGSIYYRQLAVPTYIPTPGFDTNPSSDGYWYLQPANGFYEVPNPYQVADLFDIHYVQSQDVVTLVHPNYAPMELRRLGATQWTLLQIAFGQALAAPGSVNVVQHPGYQAQISTITTANPALITTVTNHTLALGDGIYIKGLTVTIGGLPVVKDGFYLVNNVPTSGGTLVPNQLTVMDYSGNILDSTSWTAYTYATIQYGSQIFNITNYYVVTAVASDGIQESAISAEVSVLNNLNVTGSYNTITWAAAPNAFRYFIYKKRNGLYGYIGETTAASLSFNDNNIAADMSITPPNYDGLFASAGNYPGAVGYFQQRRCFAGTTNQIQTFWMSKSGTESDFSYSLPVKDSDRVQATIASRQSATIHHIVGLNQLVLLTSASEISVSPVNSDVITPTTVSARPQSYVGANNVQPTVVNNTMVYCASRGGHVREMGYQWQVGGYITGDISLRAAHLFDNLTLVDQGFSKSPWQVVWFVSSNGTLIGLTYIPEEQIGAWHHHVTSGVYESIACVAEGNEDHLYAVVNRTINGATVRYIERMASRNFGTLPNAFFVDAGATFNGTNVSNITIAATLHVSGDNLNGTYDISASANTFVYPGQTDAGDVLVVTGSDGVQYRLTILSTSSTTAANALAGRTIPAGVLTSPTSTWAWARQTISGLTWLENQTVAILADGAVQPQQVVSNTGSVTLAYPSVLVTVGLPYTASIETLPLVLQIDGAGQGRQKNINKAWVRVLSSSSISAGPSPTNLVLHKQRTTENLGTAPNLISDEIEIVVPASWNASGQIYIQQSDPLPLTVVGLTLEASIGG
jgi:hypothetical protein